MSHFDFLPTVPLLDTSWYYLTVGYDPTGVGFARGENFLADGADLVGVFFLLDFFAVDGNVFICIPSESDFVAVHIDHGQDNFCVSWRGDDDSFTDLP